MKYEVFNLFHFGGCIAKFVIRICIFVHMGIRTCWTGGQPFQFLGFMRKNWMELSDLGLMVLFLL